MGRIAVTRGLDPVEKKLIAMITDLFLKENATVKDVHDLVNEIIFIIEQREQSLREELQKSKTQT